MVRCSFFVIMLVFYSAGVSGQYENCTGQLDTLGNGQCNNENNNVECGYDGGDCCECSCATDRLYPCGIWGFNCSDPDMLRNADGCQRKSPSIAPCSSEDPETWFVNDTISATSLAAAVNCSGGTFNVIWRGRVLVDYTIDIPNGTTLYITGEGSGADVNGGGRTRLLKVVDGTLHMNGVILSKGNATYGGAIAATRSGIFLNQTLCSGIIASSYGGAIYVGMRSSLVWERKAVLTDNHAGRGGGAVAVAMGSVACWGGTTEFSSNSAIGDGTLGGVVYVSDQSRVSWNGETSFLNNIVEMYGGALSVEWDSIVSWDGVTSFVNNMAEYGGVLDVYYSSVSWDGVTSFVNNTAEYGGVLDVYYSSVSWDGLTSFVDNTGYTGGVSYVYYSSVSWDGNTFFVNTTAEYGGALDVFNSSVSWNGVTSFLDNAATFGGALRVESKSSVLWDGVTSFVDNTAHYKGVLYVGWSSVVYWSGLTYFVNNTAQYGGALSVHYYSIVSWIGETLFTTNYAVSARGAIYVATSSNISVGGDTYFLDNEAAVDGGAIYVHVSYRNTISSYFIVEHNPTIYFQGNKCGGNGGASALIGGVVTSFPPGITFLGNSAGVAGGAIYLSGVNIGIRLEGTRFTSNSALIGGGLYSTGSGTAVTEDVDGFPAQNPTTFIGCEFIGNEAVKTGGAMYSGAGKDMILNTSFIRNTASIGGALRLVGATSLNGCEFRENLSGDDEGPGISNDGVIADLSRCSFVDNVFNCPTGFFLDYNDTGARFDTICKGCDTQNSGCTVEGKEPMCLEELEYSTSAGSNTTLESLLIERGYWRATNRSMVILACYNNEACLGGLTGEQGYCGEGYEGPYCSVCSKGYTASLGFACNKCRANVAGGIAIAVVTAAVFLLAFVAFVSYMLSGEIEDADQGIVARWTRFIPLRSVKIVIVVWQILTQFSAVANVVFPSVYQSFLDSVDILNFDLTWVVSAGCIFDTDFYDQLLLTTLGPLVCMPILGGTFIVAMRRRSASEEGRGIVRRKHVSMMLLLTFLVYSSVSSTLFKAFACDKLDDGKKYLRADYRIECDSSKHKAFEIYAGFMVVMYVIGIPAFYGVLLYNNRKALTKNAGREEDESIKPITDLWNPYRPDRFYYEVIECVRRVLLTGTLVFIYPSTAAQIAVALMMATFFIFVSEALAPYASSWDTWCNRTGHAIVYASMFLALLLKMDLSGERTSSQRVFESVLVVVHSLLILIVVVETIATVVAWKEELDEDTDPSVSCPGMGESGSSEQDEASLSSEKGENVSGQ